MKQTPYSSWKIDTRHLAKLKSNSEVLTYLVELALLSPSSHNTQPWKFHIDPKNNLIQLECDPSRQLFISDPTKREFYISLGCAIATLEFAAESLGIKTNTTYDLKGNNIAKIKINYQKITANKDGLESIVNRRSNRLFYDKKSINSDSLKEIQKKNIGEADLFIVQDENDINFLADRTKKATLDIMSDKNFRNELGKWVRNNKTKKHDGMPGFVQGMPTPVSFVATKLIPNVNIAKGQAKKDASRVQHSAAVFLIMTSKQNPEAWLDAGRVYAFTTLTAQRNGISTAGVSASIIDQITSKEIITHFKLKETPVALIRAGYCSKKVKPSPRLTIEHVLAR